MKPALLLALFSCTCVTSQANHDTNCKLYFTLTAVSNCHTTQDFIETPANTTVAIITSSDSPLLWGDFSCATRLGSRPLWIVNGVSIDIITETAGYNGTYSEYFHLPHGDGNFLSFLSIPALPATNNSIVTCAAIASESSSNTIFAYSAPVHMLVVDGKPCIHRYGGSRSERLCLYSPILPPLSPALRDKNVTLITPIPSHPTSTSASMPGDYCVSNCRARGVHTKKLLNNGTLQSHSF